METVLNWSSSGRGARGGGGGGCLFIYEGSRE